MALYKENLLNKIEDDLAGRNQNWDALDALNGKLGAFEVIAGIIHPMDSITFEHSSGGITWALFAQGPSGRAYGAYILQGYGAGQNTRNHIAILQGGDQVDVSILNNSFVLSNMAGVSVYYSLIVLMGDRPIGL